MLALRPAGEHRPGVSRRHRPPSNDRVRSKYSREEMAAFAGPLAATEPADR